MIPASVGFQCPDDVRGAQQSSRRATTVFGAPAGDSRPIVTQVLLGLLVAVFVVGQLPDPDRLVSRFGNLAGAAGAFGVADGELYRLLTAAFLHADPLHLAFNGFALYSLGMTLEPQLGRVRFAALYLLSALAGSAASYVLSDPLAVGVGASGAVYGLFGALYVTARRLRLETRPIVILLLINLAITFVVPVIDWRAHLGGLVAGSVLMAVFAYVPAGPSRSRLHAAGAAAVALAVVIVVAARTAALGA